MSERLPPRPGESIRRDRPVAFDFEGKRVGGFEGDTVGSALAAAGVTITGRSFKYHRARGLFCMTGACPNCLMQIDGIPNVRSCTEPVREGMRVHRQNAWPSAGRDIHGWLNTFSFMMPPGFYYKVFQRPRWAWRTVEPFIRSKAGLGTVPRTEDHEPREVRNLHCEVLVIGGGRGRDGRGRRVGARRGPPRCCSRSAPSSGGCPRRPGTRRRSSGASSRRPAPRVLLGTAALGVFGGPLVAAADGDALYRIRARHLVFATGAVEQGAVFPNNDLPGVMLSSAVELLVRRYGVLPGRRAVVLTSGDEGYATARTLRDAGAEATVVDLRPDARPIDGIAVIAGSTVLAADGRRRVREVVVGAPGIARRALDPRGPPRARGVPGAVDEPARDDRCPDRVRRARAGVPAGRAPAGVHAAGAVAGARSTTGAIAQGRLAGLEAAAATGHAVGRYGRADRTAPGGGGGRRRPGRAAARSRATARASSWHACAWT